MKNFIALLILLALWPIFAMESDEEQRTPPNTPQRNHKYILLFKDSISGVRVFDQEVLGEEEAREKKSKLEGQYKKLLNIEVISDMNGNLSDVFNKREKQLHKDWKKLNSRHRHYLYISGELNKPHEGDGSQFYINCWGKNIAMGLYRMYKQNQSEGKQSYWKWPTNDDNSMTYWGKEVYEEFKTKEAKKKNRKT